jgi:hypothetical protein
MSKEEPKPKRNKIVSWTINIKWDNGTYENISDMNDDVAQPIDDFLTELEDERALSSSSSVRKSSIGCATSSFISDMFS